MRLLPRRQAEQQRPMANFYAGDAVGVQFKWDASAQQRGSILGHLPPRLRPSLGLENPRSPLRHKPLDLCQRRAGRRADGHRPIFPHLQIQVFHRFTGQFIENKPLWTWNLTELGFFFASPHGPTPFFPAIRPQCVGSPIFLFFRRVDYIIFLPVSQWAKAEVLKYRCNNVATESKYVYNRVGNMKT